MDLSYFSGKLEMYFRFKEISFDRIELTIKQFHETLHINTGSMQLPQVYDKRSNTWLRDTTLIIEHLEQDKEIKLKSKSIIPDCNVQAFFQRLFEDYADEFLWRPAMYWRWEPQFDQKIMGIRFSYEFARQFKGYEDYIPLFMRPWVLTMRQWLFSVFGENIDTPEKHEIVKQQYITNLDILEKILQKQPYLFGNHPTLIDFGFSGPFFRHFSSDFTPRKIMQQRAPAVYEWLARLWNCKGSKLSNESNFPQPGKLPEYWQELLQLLPEYLNYYHLNSLAYKQGKDSFDWKNKGQIFNVPVVPYRVWCRKYIQNLFENLQKNDQEIIENILRQYNCWDLLWINGKIEIQNECKVKPPFCVPHKLNEKTLMEKWDLKRILFKYILQLIWSKQAKLTYIIILLVLKFIFLIFKYRQLTNKKY